MNKLIDCAMDLYFTPFALVPENEYQKMRNRSNIKFNELKKIFLYVTNLDAIISTTSLMKIKVINFVEMADETNKKMIICTIEDSKENKKLLQKAKKEQLEYEEGMCGEELNV